MRQYSHNQQVRGQPEGWATSIIGSWLRMTNSQLIQMSSSEGKDPIRVGGEYRIPVSQEVVWNNLKDPKVLARCIRRCESVELERDGEYRAVFRFGVGPLKKRLDARLQVEETNPPAEYRLHSNVVLRSLGSAGGSARVILSSQDGGTLLTYSADILVDGWFARLGDAMITAAADRYMAGFFDRFSEIVV